jgi:hypothetical protein
VLGVVSVFAGGCSKGGAEGTGKQVSLHAQGQKPDVSSKGLAGALKDKRLGEYTATTIGQAFDSYQHFEKREWRETASSNGKSYVDFWGWFNAGALDAATKNDIVARGVEVKFVINPDGEFYVAMISRLESFADGRKILHPLADKKSILDAIYANKAISF